MVECVDMGGGWRGLMGRKESENSREREIHAKALGQKGTLHMEKGNGNGDKKKDKRELSGVWDLVLGKGCKSPHLNSAPFSQK